jgi:hypothetical protein
VDKNGAQGREERPPFQLLPPENRARVFGVDYAVCPQQDGGELWVARTAWHWLDYLQPERWWDAEQLSVCGQRLPGSTGTVYRAQSAPPGRVPRDLVVKFSRAAQDVPLFIPGEFLDALPPDAVARARFLPPFAQFGMINELRSSGLNHGVYRLRTKFPLAIYSPTEKYPLWQTGRHADIFRVHQREMAADQLDNGLTCLQMDIERDYLEIFEWIDGIDAEEANRRGLIDDDSMARLTHSSNRTLTNIGFRVLDNKPRHLIVRPDTECGLARRHGHIVYAMVDFELLQRTGEEI